MLVLRQSTAIDIRVGPFVDATDGVTPETGVTLAGADQAEVLKENGAATVAMAGTFAAVTGCDGWYDYTVAAGDVDTVGEVVFVVQDSSVCLPVFVRAMVVEEAVYDDLYDAGSAGYAGITELATLDTVADGIQTDLSNGVDGLGALKALIDIVDGIVDTINTNVSALNNVSTADINAQVVDVLKTDTVAEMAQGAPSATPTMEDILNYLYREYIRNKVVVDTNTANQKQVFADDGTTILYEKDLTNASNVTTVAEATTGA